MASVAATDIILYGCANHQENDTGTPQGGAISLSVKLEFTDIAAADTVQILSSAAGDTTQTVTITGRNTAGTIISEVLTLTGVTAVTSANTYERILKAVKSATTTGTITLRRTTGAVTIMTFDKTPNEILTVRRLFYDSASPVTGTRNYYEKGFLKNTNTTNDLTGAFAAEQADPTAKIAFAIGTAFNDTQTSTNRLTAPAAGVTAFDSANKTLPGNASLTSTATAAQNTIAVWFNLTLNAGDAATKSTYTVRGQGNTT